MNSQNRYSAARVGDYAGSVPTRSGGFSVAEMWVNRVVVVTVRGDLDALTAPALAETIQAATRKGPAALIVDLSAVAFLASAGMNLLITVDRAITPSAQFGVVAYGPTTSRPLKMIGIDTIIALYRTLDDALDAFAQPARSVER